MYYIRGCRTIQFDENVREWIRWHSKNSVRRNVNQQQQSSSNRFGLMVMSWNAYQMLVSALKLLDESSVTSGWTPDSFYGHTNHGHITNGVLTIQSTSRNSIMWNILQCTYAPFDNRYHLISLSVTQWFLPLYLSCLL